MNTQPSFPKVQILAVWLLTTGFCSASQPDILWKTNAHIHGLHGVQFGPDSTVVVSASDGPAKLWRIADTNLVRTFAIPLDDTYTIALSPDGTRLFGGGGDDHTRIWQVSDGQYLWAGGSPRGVVYEAAYSPDGSRLALACSKGRLAIWNAQNAIPDGSGGVDLEGHALNWNMKSVAFSPAGTLLASGSEDSTAMIWRVSDGTALRTLPHGGYVNAVAFSPDGKLLATGASDRFTRLWNVTNETVTNLTSGDTLALDFSPDGRFLLTASAGALKLWRVADRVLLQTFDEQMVGTPTAVDISPDGKLFAYGRGDGVLVVARMPTVITKAQSRTNQLNFDWQGGSGLYQVQQTTSVTSAVWANVGSPTAATNLAVPMTNASAFFRVQSITNAP